MKCLNVLNKLLENIDILLIFDKYTDWRMSLFELFLKVEKNAMLLNHYIINIQWDGSKEEENLNTHTLMRKFQLPRLSDDTHPAENLHSYSTC